MRLNIDLEMGLDLSLTSTGIALLNRGQYVTSENPKTDSDMRWFDRMELIVSTVTEFVKKFCPAVIMVEGYSYNSRNGREQAGELNGIVVYHLIQMGYPPNRILKVVSPNQLKKFITGNGSATKRQMVEAINETLGTSFLVKDNDRADACGLALIGHYIRTGRTLEQEFTKEQKEVMRKVKAKIKELEEGENRMSNISKELAELKVSAKSNPSSVAGSIAKNLEEGKKVELVAVGAGAVNQMAKAVAIARGYVAPIGMDIGTKIAWINLVIDGENKSGLRFILFEM